MGNVQGDRRALQRTMEAIIADSKRKAAQRQLPGLDRPAVSAPQSSSPVGTSNVPERIAELVYELVPRRRLADLVLRPELVTDIEEFLYEYSQAALLREHSLEPRHTILMVGPPGNGKTSLAEAIAAELSLPLLSVRYDAIVDSFLGETSNRLRKLIDHATLNPCVLFFDEFDAVGKERSDSQETGEIKRVVSTLLMQMDRLPSHAVVVCATNHPELLDRAVWRRFEIKLEIGRPGPAELAVWFERFEQSLGAGPIGISTQQFASHMAGENMSAVEAFTLDVRRKLVLAKGGLSAPEAVRQVLDRAIVRPPQEAEIREDEPKLSNRAPRKRARKTASPEAGGRSPSGTSEASVPKAD
ncbi:AAA family ATPase [Roseateles aquatilis]|nr:ATP-binding protein [Roseateles aquatilis]